MTISDPIKDEKLGRMKKGLIIEVVKILANSSIIWVVGPP